MKYFNALKLMLPVIVNAVVLMPAGAAALYFEKTQVKTSSEQSCMRFADDATRNQGFRNVHKNGLEVAGEKNGAYVSVTCVGRGNQPAVAVVMSVSDSFDTAKQVGHAVADYVRGVTCFEGC
jgi:hypothetical protein